MNTDLTVADAYLEALDLSYITKKMCSKYYPMPKWPLELAKQCEKQYKRFLWLLVHYPQESLVPTRDIDEFWHNHILFTQNYTKDCQALFGRYMHHEPSDPDDAQEIARLSPHFQRTKELYLQAFAEPLQVLKRDIANTLQKAIA